MTSLLSGYWAPTHEQKPYLDYYRKLQPADILILQADVQQISDAYQASPESTFTLRRWDWDDNRGEGDPGIYPHLQHDPDGYAFWLYQNYAAWVPELELQARQRGIPFPAREQLVAHHVNEPDTNYLMPQINRTTIRAAALFREKLGMGCDMLNIGTGQPALLNAHGEPDWSPLAEALDACVRYDCPAVTHEYYNDLPMTDASIYPWHIGRHAKWAPRGPKWKIGEFGLEMLVNNRRDGHHGWDGIVSQDEMIRRTAWYLDSLRDDVIAARWYMDDYADRVWRTFDSKPLHDRLIVLGWRYPSIGRAATVPPQEHKAHVPIVTVGTPPEQPHNGTGETWYRSRQFVRKWEGGYQAVENDSGNWTGGAVGEGELKGTKYGISAASYPHLDIKNLTLEQANEIYYRDYWKASGADQLPWPACLIVFDTAVLHGVGTAQTWLRESGPDPLAFAAKRLRVYTKMDNWHYWGEAWVNRVADLLMEASRGA